ncbi:MAG: zinc-ribbon domain-containing protein [Bacteroidota bacterium]|nr:zinc-ribbon domain-containing protein [Bacteroidota bacterium]
MICNRCGTQNVVNANFCSACGSQLRQQLVNPFTPGFVPNNFGVPQEDVSYRPVFIIGLVAFILDIFWAAFDLVIRVIGYEYYSKFSFVIRPLSIISSCIIAFMCVILVKNSRYKTMLIMFLILLLLVQICRHYLFEYLQNFN